MINSYAFKWTIKYASYPQATVEQDITVDVLPCLITQIVPPTETLSDIEFTIGGDSTTQEFRSFTQSPACGYDIQYSLLVDDSDIADDLELSISALSNSRNEIKIETDDVKW